MDFRRRFQFAMIALAVFAGDAVLLALTFRQILAPATLLAIHVALCLALIGWAVARRGDPVGWSALAMLAFWTFFAGPLGALVGLTIAFAAGGDEASDYGEWFERRADGERDRVAALASSLKGRRLRIGGASAARPLRDVIADGSLTEKYDALSAVVRLYDPALAPTLQLAARDPDQSVRVLAATVAIKLQARFAAKIEAGQTRLRREQNIDSAMELAEAHVRFARSGLLSREEAQDQFGKAAMRHREAVERARIAEPERLRLIEQIVQSIEDEWPMAVGRGHARETERTQGGPDLSSGPAALGDAP